MGAAEITEVYEFAFHAREDTWTCLRKVLRMHFLTGSTGVPHRNGLGCLQIKPHGIAMRQYI